MIPLSDKFLAYIESIKDVDASKLSLQKPPPDIDNKIVVNQVVGMKIARDKFPTLLGFPQYRYPPKISLEQASSEYTAKYKANIVSSARSYVDLTGGMGIDLIFGCNQYQSCTYVEPNSELYDLAMYNFEVLGQGPITGYNGTCEAFLVDNNRKYDWAYIDPSRRVDTRRKISIRQCEPNIVEILPSILKIAGNVLIKLSPMQDISECIACLHGVAHIYVVAVRSEVKELLLHVSSQHRADIDITAIDLSNMHTYRSVIGKKESTISLGDVDTYLYLPHPCLTKAQLQDEYAMSMHLYKVHANTHIYTSSFLKSDYFGRVFIILSRFPNAKQDLKKLLPEMKANIITKNYPLSPDEFGKKYSIKDGGDNYIIAFTDWQNKKVAYICSKV